MKTRSAKTRNAKTMFASLFALLVFAAGAVAQTGMPPAPTPAPGNAAILGVWRAQMDGLPAVTLTITDESGSLAGAVLFYLHRRDEGKPVTASPGVPEPLMNLIFDGQTLTFQVSHRRAHPPATLSDPPVSFRMKLTGANKASGTNLTEGSPEFEFVRSDY
jgi:hypothetical protein